MKDPFLPPWESLSASSPLIVLRGGTSVVLKAQEQLKGNREVGLVCVSCRALARGEPKRGSMLYQLADEDEQVLSSTTKAALSFSTALTRSCVGYVSTGGATHSVS